jgi:hypothetical protein
MESMSESVTVQARARRRRRRTAGWTTLASLAVLVGAALIARSWRSVLPDPVASHWGAHGTVNGFSSLDATVGVMLSGGSLLVLGFGAITLWLGQSALTRRIGAAGTIWSALFFSSLTLGSLNAQRGLVDARDAGDIGGVLVLALVGSFVVAVIVGASVPGDAHQPTTQPVDRSAPRVALAAGQRATWTGAAVSRTAILIGLAAVALVLALVLVTNLWGLLVVAVLLFGLIATMSSAVVRVDDDGVSIRSPLGWPRTSVPLDEIVRADVTQVRPLRDFGGWGWRVGRGGRVGVALRRGESLLIERTGDRSVVVTVDGAATAAGLVNALADRARSAS